MAKHTRAAAYYDQAWKDKLARSEYKTLEARWRTRWDFVVEHVREGASVLDIGCGDGVLGEELTRRKNCSVTGVDVSEHALSLAKNRGVDGTTCDVSEDHLPFDAGAFDAVILSCVLEHIPHPEKAMEEAVRVLRSGGELFVTIPNPLSFKIRRAFLFGQLHSDLLHSKAGEGLHYRFWPYHEGIDKMAEREGLPLELRIKKPDVKNPRLYSRYGLAFRRFLATRWPGLFSEYAHYLFVKRPRALR